MPAVRKARRAARLTINAIRAGGSSAKFCPVCGRHARRFLPAGDPPRADAACPWCASVERQRLLFAYLEQTGGIGDVLHVAPELGLGRELRSRASRYVSVDLTDPRADVNADVTQPIPLGGSSFDTVICSHVLEHVDDDLAAVRELARLLRPSGRLLAMIPVEADRAVTFEDWSVATPQDRLRVFGQEDHVRIYGSDVTGRFEAVGMSVEMVSWTQFADERLGINADSGDIYVLRPRTPPEPAG